MVVIRILITPDFQEHGLTQQPWGRAKPSLLQGELERKQQETLASLRPSPEMVV